MKNKTSNVIVFIWIPLMCVVHVVLFRNKVDSDIPMSKKIMLAILGLVAMLILHELIHLLVMIIFGMKNPRLEIDRDSFGIPSLKASAEGVVMKWQEIIIYAAPFLLLSVIPDIIFLSSDKVAFIFLVVSICNATGSCFDIADIVEVCRD
ncbi:MAG: metalloprotease family protein [Lachnospiraceae bacterium]|nr:metalloprotease family protein [Lachnospiraceae bacterium]